MIFWRIVDEQVYDVAETDKLGFSDEERLRIPDEYLDNQEFMVMRTAHGIGDWGIISAMPRLLKEKYHKCKVYVPSVSLLMKLFGKYKDMWSAWSNPFLNVENVFKNNPYVDGFKDGFKGEIFHDHYRIYPQSGSVPLVEQMLKFWQFSQKEREDSQPELYWSDDEIKLGDSIIDEYVGDEDFGCLLISDRYDYTMDDLIIECIDDDIKHFYWTERPIQQTEFDYIQKALDMRNMPVRIQLYIKSKAKYNIGNQCGTTQMVSRYSELRTIQRQFPIAHNSIKNEIYLTDDFKRNLLKGLPDKNESKTTTSLKFKADFFDVFKQSKTKKIRTVLEIGSSLGHTTKILSELFDKVIAVDNLPERHEQAKRLTKNDNVEYVVMDVYNDNWDFPKVDLVFIDCVHDYNHVKSDIENALKFCNKEGFFVFDDYGLFPEVKRAIDEYIDNGQLKMLKKIGHKKDNYYPNTQNKILKDYEGIICLVK